jgi:hypothetical protein
MTTLAAYRDDGPLAGWLARLAPATVAGFERAPLGWSVPPLLRLAEYGTLIAVTAVAGPEAAPFCFALLFVLAFHHYDVVYRLRHQRVPPPAWLAAAGGGWEGRIVAACALALAGGLRIGLLVGACVLGSLYAVESVSSWVRFVREGGPAPDPDTEEEAA